MIINGMKKCSRCETLLEITLFCKSKQRGDGYKYWCRKCASKKSIECARNNKEKTNSYLRSWRAANPEKMRQTHLRNYYINRDKILDREKIARDKLKAATFEAYGSACKCCGESRREFLCVDHIHGGGYQDRKANGKSIHHRLKREGYPKDKYQILCNNCNMSLGFYGYCPHHPEITRPRLSGRLRDGASRKKL